MTDTDDPQHRAYHHPDPDAVEYRDLDDDGTFGVRMPIASGGEVRNEGDEPLTREELEGMARQIDERSIGVFLDHGANRDVAASRYSAVGKVGEWRSPELTQRADTDVVEAEARLMDPETLPASTGGVREALAALKAQAERGISLASSIGWRDDEDRAGGVDLMEVSIVGIPADPRTTSESAPEAVARAALSQRDDADPEDLVAEFRAMVMGPDTRADMTDDTTESGDEPDDTNDGQDGIPAAEFREQMLEMQRQQTETLETLTESLQANDDGEDDDDEEDDEDEDEETQAADAGDGAGDGADEGDATETQALEVNGEELTADDIRELREDLETLREEDAVETPSDDAAEEGDEGETTDDAADAGGSTKYNKYGIKLSN